MGPGTKGVAAGAVGTATLNMMTYLDMAARGRPPSKIPEKVVDKITQMAEEVLPGGSGGPREEQSKEAKQRKKAVGQLLGYMVGLGLGAVYGITASRFHSRSRFLPVLLLGAGAMAASDIPAVALGVTDPKEWGPQGWLADILPHAAYGLATVLTFELLNP